MQGSWAFLSLCKFLSDRLRWRRTESARCWRWTRITRGSWRSTRGSPPTSSSGSGLLFLLICMRTRPQLHLMRMRRRTELQLTRFYCLCACADALSSSWHVVIAYAHGHTRSVLTVQLTLKCYFFSAAHAQQHFLLFCTFLKLLLFCAGALCPGWSPGSRATPWQPSRRSWRSTGSTGTHCQHNYSLWGPRKYLPCHFLRKQLPSFSSNLVFSIWPKGLLKNCVP